METEAFLRELDFLSGFIRDGHNLNMFFFVLGGFGFFWGGVSASERNVQELRLTVVMVVIKRKSTR